MLTVLENIQLADEKDMMVCQDTGLAIYKVLWGQSFAAGSALKSRSGSGVACERATRSIRCGRTRFTR